MDGFNTGGGMSQVAERMQLHIERQRMMMERLQAGGVPSRPPQPQEFPGFAGLPGNGNASALMQLMLTRQADKVTLSPEATSDAGSSTWRG